MGGQQGKKTLPPSPKLGGNCIFLPSVNQSLPKKGLIVDQVVRERKEFGKLAARLESHFQTLKYAFSETSQHKTRTRSKHPSMSTTSKSQSSNSDS